MKRNPMTGAFRIRYVFFIVLFAAGCTYKDIPTPTAIIVDCTNTTLAFETTDKTNPSSCLSIDGHFTLHVAGGVSPYQFSFDGAAYQTDSTHSALGPGTYLITVKDANGCLKSTSVEMDVVGSTLAASAVTVDDSECLTNNGSVTVTATGGTPPYSYQFGTGPQDSEDTFTNLKFGYYVIVVRDDEDCIQTLNVWVHRGQTGTSFASVIKPILDTKCSIPGCHNGDNGASINWNNLANVQKHAVNIKNRTANKTMPPNGNTALTQNEIDLIACWVDDGAKAN